jgi:hypothetical protein
MYFLPDGHKVDRLEEIITDDLKRVYRTEYFQPKALLFCIGVDFWLGTLIFGPLIFIAFRGSWQVVILISSLTET